MQPSVEAREAWRRRLSRRCRGAWWRARSVLHSVVSRDSGDSPRRLMYVFDYASTPLGDVDSTVEFRASASNFSDGEQSSGGDTDGVPVAFGDSGGVIGVLEGQIVYRASFVRADGDRLMGRPAGWLPRGRVLFLHGGSTALPFRGRGIHTAGVHWLLRNARGLDVAHAVCVVHADNIPARRSVERLGFRVVGEAP